MIWYKENFDYKDDDDDFSINNRREIDDKQNFDKKRDIDDKQNQRVW